MYVDMDSHQIPKALEHATRRGSPCDASAQTGQAGFAGERQQRSNERRLGRTRRGEHTLGCSRVGRPPRAPLNAVETKE